MKTITEQLEKKITDAMEKKHWKEFDKQARYRGNGIYEWRNNLSTCSRELFLMGIADVEGIKYTKS